jgi:large subunit ribosomal protein L4
MPELEVKDKNNNTVGTVTVSDDTGRGRKGSIVIHDVIMNFRANQRQGTHATKTKGLVRGGGKKPWRQKHTGRARAGSSRSPIWRGGGAVFGPQPRDYSYTIPKKVRKGALKEAFNKKLSDGEVLIIDRFSIEKPRTKEMLAILKNLDLHGKSVLIVLPEKDDSVMLSARNIPGVHVAGIKDLNTYTLVAHHTLLITKDAMTQLEGVKNE